MLRSPGDFSRAFTKRPAWSLVVGVAFIALGVLVSAGRAPLAAVHEVGRGETIVIGVSCLVVGGYFLRAALLGWRRRPS